MISFSKHKVLRSRDKYPRIEIGKPDNENYIIIVLEKSKKRLHVAGQMRVLKTYFAKIVDENQGVRVKQVLIQSKEPVGLGIILADSNFDFFNFTDQLSVKK